ncbi:triose-phosphate isomerase [Paraperlucidibaca sp.]|uniref:triose-phosphate isomerase n=1 Tax=Paraperlucidibaca sp. TaxID=2708021 RepID=UPI0030F391A5
MRQSWVGGNWKMNGLRESNAALLGALKGAEQLAGVDVAIAVPAPYWQQASEAMIDCAINVMAQSISPHASGAYTGDCSVAMMQDFKLSGALVGHSERRQGAGESDALVAAQFAALRGADLSAVLCVGETLAEREAGETLAVVSRQLVAVLEQYGAEALATGVLAYEPVWAIGTGLTATPEQAQAVHASLRAVVAAFDIDAANTLRIVYGGSVKADNAAGLFSMPDIDGALVGGASLSASEFLAICQAAGQIAL